MTISTSRRLAIVGVLMGFSVLFTGCSGSSSESASDSGAGSGSDTLTEGAADRAQLETANKSTNKGVNRPAVQTRLVISTGSVDLVSKDVAAVRDEIDDLLEQYDGYVSDEKTNNRPDGTPGRAMLELRFPAGDFETVMNHLEELADTRDSRSTTDDVTTKVIDVDTRVATQRASIEQLKKFLREATDVRDMVMVESEITRRQAELESLLGQQKYLADATSMSRITVHLSTPATHVDPPDALEDAGFLAGLRGGWNGLMDVLVIAATALGAILPFALAATLVGVPVWLLLRTLLRRKKARPAPPTAPAG